MKRLLTIAGLIALAGCANAPAAKPATASSTTPRMAADPYPSTYRPYGGRPTAIRNVTIYDGEGGRIDGGTVFVSGGKVTAVGGADTQVPADATVIDGTGKWVTPGVIDIHSHLGDYPSPGVAANSDGNEVTNPVHPDVWAEHSVWPQDPGFSRALVNGGITSLEILPGSANLFGGRSVVLKNVYARTVQGMKFPGAPYGLKMACGENPKRVYGSRNQMPGTRMGNIALDRATWLRADDYRRKRATGKDYTRDIGMETLADVLDGKIRVQNHCYRADEMAIVMDMAKEFGYKVSAFHHAVESYKIADLLRDNGVCAVMWADWYGFKMEAYDAIPESVAMVQNAGACAIVHSDDPDDIQHLNQEAGKALASGRRMGLKITDAQAWSWISYNPAKALGIDAMTGSLKPGKMADMVLWNGDPLSNMSRPEKIWIDGALLFDMDTGLRPVSDFELGQPGEGDVK